MSIGSAGDPNIYNDPSTFFESFDFDLDRAIDDLIRQPQRTIVVVEPDKDYVPLTAEQVAAAQRLVTAPLPQDKIASSEAGPGPPEEPSWVLPSLKWNLSRGEVGLIAIVMAILVIATLIVGLYFGNANAHDLLTRKITIADTLLYAGVPVVGLALVFGFGLYIYKKHQKRLSDMVDYAVDKNRTIGNSPAYAEPRSPEGKENQKRDLEAALDKQRLAQWGKTLKELVPTRKQWAITGIVLLVLAGLAVGGYFLFTHVSAAQHWMNHDLIPAFNHSIQAWEAIAYSGAAVGGILLVVITIKKVAPPVLKKIKVAFGKWEEARQRCPYTDHSFPEFSEESH